MIITYSDLCLLGGDLTDNVTRLTEQGAQCIEFMMDGGAWEGYGGNADELIARLRSLGASYALHSPCWDVNLTSENAWIRRASLDSTKQAVEFGARLGCSHVVVHPGFRMAPVFSRELALERARTALAELADLAGERGVRLAIENVGYNGASLFTQQEFATLLEGVGDSAWYLIDTGHAILNGWDIPALVRQLAPRLCGMHLHDNDGVSDSHRPIGRGVIDWGPVIREMGKLPETFSAIFEYNFGVPPAELEQGKAWLLGQLAVTQGRDDG